MLLLTYDCILAIALITQLRYKTSSVVKKKSAFFCSECYECFSTAALSVLFSEHEIDSFPIRLFPKSIPAIYDDCFVIEVKTL